MEETGLFQFTTPFFLRRKRKVFKNNNFPFS